MHAGKPGGHACRDFGALEPDVGRQTDAEHGEKTRERHQLQFQHFLGVFVGFLAGLGANAAGLRHLPCELAPVTKPGRAGLFGPQL
jgi:hypothetical protein